MYDENVLGALEVEKRKELTLGSTRIGRALNATVSPQNLSEIEPGALHPIPTGTSPNYGTTQRQVYIHVRVNSRVS